MIVKWKSRIDIPLILIAILAAFLNGYNIWTDHYVNTYYTTTVASMLKNFHNFFFGSLDSAGSVTVDKPPVTFWIQTLFAAIFGLHGWSVILPQALAGVGSVFLIYFLVKPSFGLTAARLSALGFALTPIVAAVSRTNNIDSLLVFTLLIAAWLLFRSIKRSSIPSLFGSFAVIGLAFNMKMLQAYMVLPAFYLLYVMAAKWKWKKKIALLTGASVLMLTISLSWAVIVDSIPAKDRPYIGSSQTNSVLELAFGYNGISRLTGNQGPGAGSKNTMNQQPPNNTSTSSSNMNSGTAAIGNMNTAQGEGTIGSSGNGANSGTSPNGGPGAGNGGTFGGPGGGNSQGMFNTGVIGPLRLFQSSLSGQASWLLPFVIIASAALLSRSRIRKMTLQQKEVLFWLAWLLPAAVFFSVAGFFHQYYLIMLAPPVAALFGIGSIQLIEDYKKGSGWRAWLLPLAVAATAIFQWYIIHPYDDVIGSGWSIGVLAAGILFSIILIFYKNKNQKIMTKVMVSGLLVLLIGPLYWAATPIIYGDNSMLPAAGPTANSGADGMEGPPGGRATAFNPQDGGAFGPPSGNMNSSQSGNSNWQSTGGGYPSQNGSNQPSFPNNMSNQTTNKNNFAGNHGGMGEASLDSKTLKYLKDHNTGEQYLFATTSYQTAAPYIIDKGESVIIMGGFSGNDPVYTVSKIKELVSSGKVKFFLISTGGMGGQSSDVTKWIQQNGKKISSSKWQSNSTSGQRGPGGTDVLYEVTK